MFAVRMIAPTFDRRTVHETGTGTRENIARGKGFGIALQMLLDICRRGDDFEGGTRLVHVADRAISRERIQKRGVLSRHLVQIVRGIARKCQHLEGIDV